MESKKRPEPPLNINIAMNGRPELVTPQIQTDLPQTLETRVNNQVRVGK